MKIIGIVWNQGFLERIVDEMILLKGSNNSLKREFLEITRTNK